MCLSLAEVCRRCSSFIGTCRRFCLAMCLDERLRLLLCQPCLATRAGFAERRGCGLIRDLAKAVPGCMDTRVQLWWRRALGLDKDCVNANWEAGRCRCSDVVGHDALADTDPTCQRGC